MDELVKQCRDCIDCLCGECKYEHLQKPGNFVPCMNALLGEAADAIEELSMKLHGDEAAIAGMKREIERMVVSGNMPRWIPVTERLPKEMETVLVTDGKNVGWSFCVNDYGTLYFYSPWNITHWMPLPEPPQEENK